MFSFAVVAKKLPIIHIDEFGAVSSLVTKDRAKDILTTINKIAELEHLRQNSLPVLATQGEAIEVTRKLILG